MRRVLWCGGSHLGTAKNSAISAIHSGLLREFTADFYITAAPANRTWSWQGGRYQVDGTTVYGNRAMRMERRHLDRYEVIIFVGQWIQPWCIFRDAMPLSDAVLQRCLHQQPLHPSIIRGGKSLNWYNEPLELFPVLAPGKVLLIRDPEACIDSYQAVPVNLKQAYASHLELFCRRKKIMLCPQFTQALDRRLTTDRRYLRDPRGRDPVHMSDHYWQLLFDRLLSPMLRDKLQIA